MGAVADLPIPSRTGAVGELPVPSGTPNVSPEQADVEATQAIQGGFRRGLRSSMISLGGALNALASGVGENLGLSDFAADRMRAAEADMSHADEIGPRVRDVKGIRDFADAVDFTAGLAGENAGAMIPMAGGAAVKGLRGAVAAMYPLEVGGQLYRTRNAPASPGAKLAAAAGTGAVSTAAQVAVPAKLAGAAERGAVSLVAPEVAKGGVGMGVAQAAAEAARQAGHTVVEPSRDKSGDTEAIVNQGIGGVIAGGALGLGTGLAGRAKNIVEARRELGIRSRPTPAEPDIEKLPDDIEGIERGVAEHDAKVDAELAGAQSQEWAKKYEGWQEDPDKRDAFKAEYDAKHRDEVDRPFVKKAMESIGKFMDRFRPAAKDDVEKPSRVRTKLDDTILDEVNSVLPEHLNASMTALEKFKLAMDVRDFALHASDRKIELPGPGRPELRTGEGRATTSHADSGVAMEKVEGQRESIRHVPHGLMDIFGDQLQGLLSKVQQHLMKGGVRSGEKVNWKKALGVATKSRGALGARLDDVVRTHLDPTYLEDPQTRDESVTFARNRVMDMVQTGKFDEKLLDKLFGKGKQDVLDAFDKMRDDVTQEYSPLAEPRTDESTAQKLSEGERSPDELGGAEPTEPEVNPTGEQASRAEQQHPARDPRLGVPMSLDQARRTYADLAAEYRGMPVRFKPVVHEDGRVTLHAEDGQSPTSFSQPERNRIKDKYGKAGHANSVVTVVMKDIRPGMEGRNTELAVSIPNLTRQVIRDGVPAGKGSFAQRAVMEGLSRLLGDENFVRLKEGNTLDFPDDMVVARLRGQDVKWGDVKKGLTHDELKAQRVTTDMVDAAQGAEKLLEVDADEVSNADKLLDRMAGNLRRAQQSKDERMVSRLEEAIAQVEEEVKRRKEEGDFPAHDKNIERGIASTEEITESQSRKGEGPRYYEADTGLAVGQERRDTTEPSQSENAQMLAKEERKAREYKEMTEGASDAEKQARKDSKEQPQHIGELPMYYKMPKEAVRSDLRSKYPNGTSTAELMANGDRVATTRKAFGRPGDTFTVKGETYRIKSVKPIDFDTPEGRAAWAKLEGWDPDYVAKNLGNQVRTGALQTVFEKVGKTEKKSEMRVGREPLSEETKAAMSAEIERVLGPEVHKALRAKMQAAGKFIADEDGNETILINTHALDPMGVAYHETMHGLLHRLSKANPEAANTLMNAAHSPTVQARLRELLKGEPAALKQLEDPEERAAYMYEFWRQGALKVGPKTETLFQKIQKWLKATAHELFGLGYDPATQAKAEELMAAFQRGDFADRSKVTEVASKLVPKDKLSEGLMGKTFDLANRVLSTADGYVRDMKIPALTAIADKMLSPLDSSGIGSGMMQTRHVAFNRFMNRYSVATKGLDKEAVGRVLESLQRQDDSLLTNQAEKSAKAALRGLLDDVFEYMQKKGVKAVEWNEAAKKYDEHDIEKVKDYFPRMFDRAYIEAHQGEFLDMLGRNKVENPKAVLDKLMTASKASPEESDGTAGITFFAPSTMVRKLKLPESELAPFMKKDLGSIMYDYMRYATRRGEYAERFGNQGQEIAKAVDQAVKQGATPDQIKHFNSYVQAMEGTLGNHIDTGLRKFMSSVLAYQNWRLLPLSLFSSLVDPNGIVVRGGTVSEGFNAFTRGVRELVSTKEDEQRAFARAVGAINDATEEHMVADMYGMHQGASWAKWLNDTLFKYNGMESWNNSMRTSAAAAARNFLVRHATEPGKHSERYLSELGLKAEDVRVGSDGKLDITEPKVVDAINKWVDGAVLRPHAGTRPIWGSDPHYMLMIHLKQFSYSFQKTIVAQTAHELAHGNVRPLAVLASYVPFIIAADVLRSMVTPGSGDNDRYAKWGAKEWLAHGLSRSGIAGPGQYIGDSINDTAAGRWPLEPFGPTTQQMGDLLRASLGAPGTSFQTEALRAVPVVPTLFPGRLDRIANED